MNCEWIRQRIINQSTHIEVGGKTVKVCKLGASDGIVLNGILLGMQTKGEGDDITIADPADLVRFYAHLVSKTVIDDAGNRPLDSDEGRELLGKMPRDEFLAFGEAVANWTLPDQKKS